MRWTSRSWLWGLLVLLLLGLILMHHAPGHGAHGSELATVPTASAGSGVAMGASGVADCSCPAMAHQASLPGGSGGPDTTAFLHLCLAVLVALGGLLSAGLILRWTVAQVGGAVVRPAWRRGGSPYLRPAVPVPRHLAALCVLRL